MVCLHQYNQLKVRQCIPALVQGVRTLNSTLIHGTLSSNHPASYQQQYNLLESGKQRSYRERNPNGNRCYICNEPGHHDQQCPRKGNQRQPPQQYSDQRYPQPQYDVPYYQPIKHPHLPSLQARPVEEVRTIMAPAKVGKSEESYVKA